MRRGATIPELLIAMLVLLLGIWVVAAKFPQLAAIVSGEKTRDKMARKAEQAVEQARENVTELPTLIAPYDSTLVAATTNPYGIAESVSGFYDPKVKLDQTNKTRPPNCVESTLIVVGETFHLPAPPLPSPVVLHFLKLGPAEHVYRVYQPIPLTRDDSRDPFSRDLTGPPAQPVTPFPGSFYMRSDGAIRFVLPQRDPDGNPFTPNIPSNKAQLEVSYDWMDSAKSPNPHHMVGELVDATLDTGQTINWTTSPVSVMDPKISGQVVPNSVTATFRYDYEVLPSNGSRNTTAPPAYIDVNFGHALTFDASEEGKTLCVDYRLSTCTTDPDKGRRIPLAYEVHRVPQDAVSGVGEVQLDFQQVDDQTPVFTTDLSGAALATPPHVIAFDLETGRTYSDVSTGAGELDVSYVVSGSPSTTVLGWMEGRVSFPATSPALGRTLVFYYRNLDRQTVQLQRAPATFAEDTFTPNKLDLPAWALGRWFRPERPAGTYDPTSPTLVFPDSCLSQTVQVDYLLQGQRRVEVHTLGEQSPATLTLDVAPDANVQILSVKGISVKGFATWTDRAKLREINVETLLPAQLDATLAKEPHSGALQP